MIIYHNPRCSKSRAAIAHLQTLNVEFTTVSYLSQPPAAETIIELIQRSASAPEAFVRWADAAKEGREKPCNPDAPTIAKLLSENPALLQRPVVDTGEEVIICRSDEALSQLTLEANKLK